MSYELPDEPRGAVRPGLAVGVLWPLATLMIVGPLAGFGWLAFNSWALGCRRALAHTAAALAGIVAAGLAVLAVGTLAPGLVPRLLLVAVHAAALAVAYWMMIGQDDAEQWRRASGPPVANGLPVFAVLLAVRLLGSGVVPPAAAAFLFWAAT